MYTMADVKISQYIRIRMENSKSQISHHDIFHFLKYARFRYAKSLFRNIQKQ